LVNDVAAQRSQDRGALSFVPVLSAVGASVALVGSPIMLADVLRWPPREFGYGDPARAVALKALAPKSWGRTFDDAVAEVLAATPAVEETELAAAASAARARFAALRSALVIESSPLAATRTLAAIAGHSACCKQ
jgi:hypothetical protein